MKTSMQSLFLLLLVILASGEAFHGEALSDATRRGRAEHNALVALKQALGYHYLLKKTWIRGQCSSNRTTWYGLHCVNNQVSSISLEGLSLSGHIDDPQILANLTELTLLSFKNNSISGAMLDFSSNIKITTVDLSMNLFSGLIPNSSLGLNLLQSLQLNENNFSGPLPPFNQSGLRSFNVSYNNLTGMIPNTSTLQSFDWTSYIFNPHLCGTPSPIACDSIAKDENKQSSLFPQSGIVTIFVILDAIVLVILIWCINVFCKKAKKAEVLMKKSEEDNKNEGDIDSEEKRSIVREEQKKVIFVNGAGDFDLNDLLRASAEGLGKGSFGSCFKVMAKNDQAVVVKRLRDVGPLTSGEFMNHMARLASFEHPNLLPLLGYYYSADEKLLIYDFVHKGNLFDRIHGGRGPDRIPFRWNSRLSVAKGVARAMEYLHLNARGQLAVPHGNLKASNVLLDEKDAPLVSDYGLTLLIPTTLAVLRMMSYKSPEYHYYRNVSMKSDVWSYGCLIIELLTGKMPSYSAPDGTEGVDLCNWVNRAVREEWTCEVFDVEIAVRRSAMQGMFLLLQIALKCCDKSPEKRPEMTEVAMEVEAIRACESDDEEEDYSIEQSIPEESPLDNDYGVAADGTLCRDA